MHRGYFFAEYARKIEENAGKIGEFPRNSFPEVAEPKGDPVVVFGRFWSFLQSFPVILGYDSDSFRFLSVFIPFHSFLFLLLKSARFYALQHVYCRYFVREVECLKYYCYFCT